VELGRSQRLPCRTRYVVSTHPPSSTHGSSRARGSRAELLELLREMVKAGELRRGTDSRVLVRALEIALNGALFNWTCYQEGTAAEFMRSAVDAVLAPHRPRKRVSAR
jgi:hypothetical protein